MKIQYSLWSAVAAVAILGCEWMTPGSNLLAPGSVAPEFQVDEWVGGSAPATDGKVVVVDFWAHWCGPCRAAAPELVKTYHEFADEDVEFVGLTSDGADAREEIEAFHNKVNIPWATGIGAGDTLREYGVEYIPTVFVIGRDGKVFWNSDRPGELKDAIQGALDQEIK